MTAPPVEGTVLLVEDEPPQRKILARIARQLAGGGILVTEIEAEVELLCDLGSDIVQGFAIAGPMTAERFADWQARPPTG